MATKIVRLSERDITRLIRKVIKEEEFERDFSNYPVVEFNKFIAHLSTGTKKSVQKVLNKLPHTIRFIAILNCEGADFSDVDLCSFPDLVSVNLRNTPNNFKNVVNCDYIEMSRNHFQLNVNEH